ncbi:TPA: hypothetical protein ACIJ2W_006856 [Pseudomonas aeruginosa]
MKLAAAQSDLPHSSRIELTGSARATERSILGFETGGRIAKLNVDVGEGSPAAKSWQNLMRNLTGFA